MKVGKIKSKREFEEFLSNLQKDLKENPNEWENITLESYLEAIMAWVIDMEGYYRNNNLLPPENINWEVLKDILLAGKYYE